MRNRMAGWNACPVSENWYGTYFFRFVVPP
jgi:hypothetical protein